MSHRSKSSVCAAPTWRACKTISRRRLAQKSKFLLRRHRGAGTRSTVMILQICPASCGAFLCDENHDAVASSKLRCASRQRIKFAMSEREPSGRLIRYIPGHFESGTMRGSSLGGLRLSVTLSGFCLSDIPIVVVTLRTASRPTPGRVAATLTGVPRSRARCEIFRQRELQKRAVERCGLNCKPQVRQVALMTPRVRVSPSAKPRGLALADRVGLS